MSVQGIHIWLAINVRKIHLHRGRVSVSFPAEAMREWGLDE